MRQRQIFAPTQRFFIVLIGVLWFGLVIIRPSIAEPPTNPFGNLGETDPEMGETDPKEEYNEDDFPMEGEEGYGSFPPPLYDPQSPKTQPPAAGAKRPQVPPPPTNRTTPSPPRSTPPKTVNRRRQPTPRTQAPPKARSATPSFASPSTTPTSKQNFANYLELDAATKGLQVQNFDLQDQEIRNVVKLISKWTGKNFIVDQKVRGKITILGPSQVTLQEAYQAFLSSLAANGLTTVQSGKFIRIIESAEARRSPVKTYVGDYAPEDDQFITRIFQLRYINADEVQREFRDMTTRQGKLFAYEPTNSVIITDTGSNIKRIKEILDSLDIPTYETTLHVLPIENSSAKKISELLSQIYGETGGTGTRRTGSRRSFRRSALERTRGGGIISKIVPDEQTNSLVILANDRGFHQLRSLVRRLDIKSTDSGRIQVYYCEYAKAEDLAATLAALATGSSGRTASARSARDRRTGRRSTDRRRGANRRTPARPSGPISADLGEGIQITSDAPTNALVITANPSDFQTIKRVIKKLDIPRLQVFVESAILEVTLDDTTNIGVNLAVGSPERPIAGGFIGDTNSLSSILTGVPVEGATIPIFGGSSHAAPIIIGNTSTTVNTRSFMGVINLLTKTTNASILSTPQIIALDNEEAVFKVQDETPVQGGSTTTATATNTSVERLKSGIEIKLTPHVNAASGTIRLDIEQTVDSLRPATDVPSGLRDVQRAKTSRVTNTSVVVRNEDYVMLGGLISDNISEIATKVPLLGDIPILGWLFKSKSYKKVKSNLVILLRPTIIGTTLDSADLIDKNLKKRHGFIEDHQNGEDAHKPRVNVLREEIGAQRKRGRGAKLYNYRSNENLRPVEPGKKAVQTPKPSPPSKPTTPAAPPRSESEMGDDMKALLQDESSASQESAMGTPRVGEPGRPEQKKVEQDVKPKTDDALLPFEEENNLELLPPEPDDFVTTPGEDPFFPSKTPEDSDTEAVFTPPDTSPVDDFLPLTPGPSGPDTEGDVENEEDIPLLEDDVQ